jgi:hypothetical protein
VLICIAALIPRVFLENIVLMIVLWRQGYQDHLCGVVCEGYCVFFVWEDFDIRRGSIPRSMA